jgi:hypothetical protein
MAVCGKGGDRARAVLSGVEIPGRAEGRGALAPPKLSGPMKAPHRNAPRSAARALAGALLLWSAPPFAQGPPAQATPPLDREVERRAFAALQALLTAPAQERQPAIERLAADLDLSLAAALSGALADADAERRLRLERALGDSTAAPELLLRLLADGRSDVRRSAERALAARFERFAPGADLPFLRGDDLPEALVERLRDEPLTWFELSLGEDPRLNAERLSLADPGPLPLLIDPGLAESARRFPAPPLTLRGSFDQLAFEIARQAGLELVLAFSAGDAPGDPPRPLFLCLALEGQPVGATTRELWIGWHRSLALAGPDQGAAAARALCLSGSGEALELCAILAFEQGHRGALSGVLAAAAEGRVHPGLLDPGRFEALLSRALDELAGGAPAPLASELAAAVERFPRRGPGGADLGALVLARQGQGERQQRFLLRLAGFLGGGSAELDARLVGGWSAAPGAAGSGLRRQALLSAAAGASPGFRLGPCGDPRALLPLLLRGEELRRLGRAGEAAGALGGPADWIWIGPGADPGLATLPEVLRARAEGLSLRWLASRGEPAQSAARLARALAAAEATPSLEALAEAFEDWAADGRLAELEALVSALEDAAPLELFPRIDRFVVRLGLGDGARRTRLQTAVLASAEPDWEALASLAGCAEGAPSRERLLAELRRCLEPAEPAAARPAILYTALGQGIEGLRRRGLDAEALRFQQAIVAACRRRSDHELSRSLLSRAWPPPPGLAARSLLAEDWSADVP